MTPTRAALLITGSEILLGRIQDQNSAYLAQQLDEQGIDLTRIVIVSDESDAISTGLADLLQDDVGMVITSGGLGPTHDDRTVEAIARVSGRPLVVDEATRLQIAAITRRFAEQRGIDHGVFAAGDEKQAMIPRGASVLAPVGTAPGLVVSVNKQVVVVLPGPPHELRQMWPRAMAHPRVAALTTAASDRYTIRLYEAPESRVADAFAEVGGDENGTRTTICAGRGEVEVVVRSGSANPGQGAALASRLRERLAKYVYSTEATPLAEIVIRELRQRRLTLALAESCTGGGVAAALTRIAGASDVVLGGLVVYADDAKRDLLGIDPRVLAEHGAVSAACAAAMARAVRERLHASIGVSVTGIAGPGGATPTKPVGLVFLHATSDACDLPLERHFPGPRGVVQDWAVTAALQLTRRIAVGEDHT
jgi:nicotinamide-nucleotide amidase